MKCLEHDFVDLRSFGVDQLRRDGLSAAAALVEQHFGSVTELVGAAGAEEVNFLQVTLQVVRTHRFFSTKVASVTLGVNAAPTFRW